MVFGATTGGERRGVLESATLLTCSPASLVFKASVASPTAALVNPLAPAYCTEYVHNNVIIRSKNPGYIVSKLWRAIN